MSLFSRTQWPAVPLSGQVLVSNGTNAPSWSHVIDEHTDKLFKLLSKLELRSVKALSTATLTVTSGTGFVTLPAAVISSSIVSVVTTSDLPIVVKSGI